ncbi:sensor histidine kinase [Streptomyces sp. NPDC090106]|uniref:sensor histidine kinase n=1 Tax=Streptomyces sp. NPDC090106 TaxID=3365946 RepID=UPI00382EADAC
MNGNNLERYAHDHPRIVDAMVSVTLFACTMFGASIRTGIAGDQPDVWPARIVGAVAAVTILWARDRPRSVLLVNAAGSAALAAVGYLPSPLLLAPVMAALYWFADRTDSRTTRIHGSVTLAALVVASLSSAPFGNLFLLRTVGIGLWLMLPLAAGSAARIRRAYLESVQARAAHAERTREEEARLRVAEERMRIARELHDVVAHHMAVANAQAGTAAHLVATRPDQARQILADLAGTTSSALLELRATVGVLRHSGDDSDSLEPSPGLDRLPELVTVCASAGLDVTVTTDGEPRPLLPGVDLTAYRIIQEALTNVAKHASGHEARVLLRYERARLLITVTDDGTGTAARDGGGFGLIGMRERAHSVGGDLCAGPRPEGGFEVATALPLHPKDR